MIRVTKVAGITVYMHDDLLWVPIEDVIRIYAHGTVEDLARVLREHNALRYGNEAEDEAEDEE